MGSIEWSSSHLEPVATKEGTRDPKPDVRTGCMRFGEWQSPTILVSSILNGSIMITTMHQSEASFQWNISSIWTVIRSLSTATLIYAATLPRFDVISGAPNGCLSRVITCSTRICPRHATSHRSTSENGSSSTTDHLISAKFHDQNVVGSLAQRWKTQSTYSPRMSLCEVLSGNFEAASPAAVGKLGELLDARNHQAETVVKAHHR